MNIKQFAACTRKDFIYNIYSQILQHPKEYQRITREKMCLEIVNTIKETDHINTYISYEEYEVLLQLLNNYFPKNIKKKVYDHLCSCFLVVYDLYKKEYVILDELRDELKSQLDCIDKQEFKSKQKLDQYVPAIIQVYGMLSYQQFQNCLEHYLPHIKDPMSLFLNQKYYVQYYCLEIWQQHQLLLDQRFLEYSEEFLNVYQNFNGFIQDECFIPPKILFSIYQHHLNLYDAASQQLYQTLQELPSDTQKEILQKLTLYTHLQIVIDENFLPFQISHKDNYQHFLSPIIKVSQKLPSTMFHGYNENQFLKRYPHFKSRNAKLSYEDACLFLKIYFAVLEYTNNSYHIESSLEHIDQWTSLDSHKATKISDYLFHNRHIIDDFINLNSYHFSNAELQLINAFQYTISDTFIIMKYDHQYTYVMGKQGNFAIKGIHHTIEEIVPAKKLPYASPMHLIPFKGYIICDGILTGEMIEFSRHVLQQLSTGFKNNKTYYSIDRSHEGEA